jgi:EAL and modified HD-GYP domain-containing signal transduction protein
MDVILQKPLYEILDELMIPQEVKNALVGRERNYYSKILDIVISYQKGEWAKSIMMASYLDIDRQDLAISYLKTIKWLDEAIPEL